MVFPVVPAVLDSCAFHAPPAGDALHTEYCKWMSCTTVCQRRQIPTSVFSWSYLLQVIWSNTIRVLALRPNMINLHTWSDGAYPEFVGIPMRRNSNWLACNFESEVTVPPSSTVNLPLPTPTSIFVTLINLHDEAVRGGQAMSGHMVMLSPFERR